MESSPSKLSTASKILSPDKSVAAFMTSIQDNKEAFDLFREKASRMGYLGRQKPLLHAQNDYYNKYISRSNTKSMDFDNSTDSLKANICYRTV